MRPSGQVFCPPSLVCDHRTAPLTEETKAALEPMLDKRPRPCFVIGHDGVLVFHNRAAALAIQRNRGVQLSHQGRLVLQSTATQALLERKIQAALCPENHPTGENHDPFTFPVPNEPGPNSIRVFALVDGLPPATVPTTRMEFTNSRVALVVVRYLNDTIAVTTAQLKSSFGLTAREAEVALALIRYDTTRKVAAALGMPEATAQWHVANIRKQTNTRSKIEFMQLVSSLLRQHDI